MIARADQPDLRLAEAVPAAAWASAELLERARRVFSRLYQRPVSVAEVRGMLERSAVVMGPESLEANR